MEPSHKKLYAALAAEFLGMLLFALYGGEARDSAAAYGNGPALAVLVYATANVSGGHLNPAVTLGTIISGHMGWRSGLLYMAAQFLGGIVGERGSVGASWEAGWLARRAYKGWSGSSGGGGQLGGESPLHAAHRLRLPHAAIWRLIMQSPPAISFPNGRWGHVSVNLCTTRSLIGLGKERNRTWQPRTQLAKVHHQRQRVHRLVLHFAHQCRLHSTVQPCQNQDQVLALCMAHLLCIPIPIYQHPYHCASTPLPVRAAAAAAAPARPMHRGAPSTNQGTSAAAATAPSHRQLGGRRIRGTRDLYLGRTGSEGAPVHCAMPAPSCLFCACSTSSLPAQLHDASTLPAQKGARAVVHEVAAVERGPLSLVRLPSELHE